jgi:hypothetical protein
VTNKSVTTWREFIDLFLMAKRSKREMGEKEAPFARGMRVAQGEKLNDISYKGDERDDR